MGYLLKAVSLHCVNFIVYPQLRECTGIKLGLEVLFENLVLEILKNKWPLVFFLLGGNSVALLLKILKFLMVLLRFDLFGLIVNIEGKDIVHFLFFI